MNHPILKSCALRDFPDCFWLESWHSAHEAPSMSQMKQFLGIRIKLMPSQLVKREHERRVITYMHIYMYAHVYAQTSVYMHIHHYASVYFLFIRICVIFTVYGICMCMCAYV